MSANLELVNAVLAFYASRFSDGRIDIFEGSSQPSVNIGSLASYVVLASIPLPNEPFNITGTDGYITNLGSWQGWRNNVAGNMGWFRMYSNDEAEWIQGDLSEIGGGGMMQLPTLDILTGSFLVVDQVRIDFI